jgi:hypothetical protein
MVRRAEEALGWFVTHGGNVDVKEWWDHCADLTQITAKVYFNGDLANIETRGQDREMRCVFCGREDAPKLLQCSRCKKAKYCGPSSSQYQKIDWPRHRPGCKAA